MRMWLRCMHGACQELNQCANGGKFPIVTGKIDLGAVACVERYPLNTVLPLPIYAFFAFPAVKTQPKK